jgi:hypothetical protein
MVALIGCHFVDSGDVPTMHWQRENDWVRS